MADIIVVARDGSEHVMSAADGLTLMEAIRDAGQDDMLALCGGGCACATCHVIVDPDFAGPLEPMSEDEDALLDTSEHRVATSRLSCQIRVSDALAGLRVAIAPED